MSKDEYDLDDTNIQKEEILKELLDEAVKIKLKEIEEIDNEEEEN